MIFYSLKLKIKHTERIQDESDQNNKVQNCKPGKTFDISLHRSDSLLHLVHLLDLGIKFVEQILNVAVALYVLRMYLLGEICLDGFQLCCRILKQRLDLGDLSLGKLLVRDCLLLQNCLFVASCSSESFLFAAI